MIETTEKIIYKAFRLTISSEYDLPELLKETSNYIDTDVVIKKGDLTAQWAELAEPNQTFVIKANLIMFHMPNVAIFSITNGRNIVVSPLDQASDDHIRLYLLGTCMGAILMQRKILPLHGSAIAIDGKAYAIVGDSGAGKSTTASALLKLGYELISDDVIPVTLTPDNVPMVTPAYPQQKLWQESLDEFGMDSGNLRPIVDRETKFAIPVLSQFTTESLPLAGIFELVKTEGEELDIQPIKNLERFHTLFYHTYRNFFLKPSGLMEWHFATCAAMVNKLELFQIQRPTSRFTANEISALVLSKIKKEIRI
ncbi:aldolase [Salipaludibacillus neizhouensis]|uniref:Aldolase n=1 Tax=Salipaludibacillus neizhouensis TaxID=885475 RepID=A0A3A9K7S0_9BACI|nr:aldolase [Salipaludibacillus neizhouensis]RKL66391.1 aldolase [Salipaludibacillus neizhouensis]